jgi:CheY-like chemotaxis protein
LHKTIDLLSIAGRSGSTPADFTMLARILEDFAAESEACGLEPAATATRSLTARLDEPVPVPRKMVTSQLKALIDACRNAAVAPDDACRFEMDDTQADVVLPNFPRRTVLIVDDDADLRGLLARAISSFADVIEGGSAREAYALMKRRQPDLVILDDKMPGDASGMMLLERSRKRAGLRDIPVVMMSARCSEEQITHARLSGAADFFAKPFDPAETAERIKRRLFRLGKKG